MKADRLVATLLFLQSRGRVTATEVAAELEVSERTARRDLEALAAAGIPVYSQRGRGGGWSLVGGARTDLTGLTTGEVRALFLLAGLSASATPELRTALRKLVRALPSPLRSDAEAASKALILDGTAWRRPAAPVSPTPHLETLQNAVVEGVQIRLGYAKPGEPAGERTAHPLGLVSKSGVWYLVADTDQGLRTFRLSRITSVTPTGTPVIRPDDFDLAAFWHSLTARMDERMHASTVRGRVERTAIPILQRLLGGQLRVAPSHGGEWSAFEADGPSPEIVAALTAGLTPRVEILEPPEARQRLSLLSTELAALYGPPRFTET